MSVGAKVATIFCVAPGESDGFLASNVLSQVRKGIRRRLVVEPAQCRVLFPTRPTARNVALGVCLVEFAFW